MSVLLRLNLAPLATSERIRMLNRKRKGIGLILVGLIAASGCHRHHDIAVTTYHYDNGRTGWDPNETELTYSRVADTTKFQLRHNVPLDDQVDTQPLLVPGETITGGSNPGKHDVVYVATEGNTIYAIDAASGAVLLNPNFGPPVPTPQGCTNNGPNVGIDGTPVIDSASNTMYVIVYTLEAGGPTYRIHALDLSNLADKIPPRFVSASRNGFNFQAAWQRQRAGLLLSQGKVYAGFGSFCDWGGTNSRGWLLGWHAGSLAPLAANQLNDVSPTAPNNAPNGRFLASIWMSGYGVAADAFGNIYFVTGNSDSNYTAPPVPGPVTPNTSIQESVVKMSGDLATVKSYFTPFNAASLDSGDTDYGSGGALLLPDQDGPKRHLASAAGKDGRMFLLDRDSLGGFTPPVGPDHVLGMVNIDGCWCGPSYYSASPDGLARVVSSGGATVKVWKVQTSPSVALLLDSASAPIASGAQDPGFFTSISSAGATEPIIWAVSRPENASPAEIYLYAFNAGGSGGGTLPLLRKLPAGTWPNVGGNANIVPTVANGWVYVASYKQLQMFGLL